MSRPGRSVLLATVAAVFCLCARLHASEIQLKDGRTLRGALGRVASLADKPQAIDPGGAGAARLIVFVDDELRRTFVSKYQIQPGTGVRQVDPGGHVEEKFAINQRAAKAGRLVGTVGPVIHIDDFDEFGRRIFTFNTVKGPVDVVQGITLLTPKWTKVEGISHIWDMRIATSSIPPEILHKVLHRHIDLTDVEHRKKVARFYLQAERYKEARQELEDILKTFPGQGDIAEQLAPSIRALRQMSAQRLLEELKLRRKAGQHRLVLARLETFPSEDVAGEILQAVQEMIDGYKQTRARGEETLKQLDALLAEIEQPRARQQIQPIRDEILAELNINTLGRMVAFRQNVDDEELLPEEKLSLAVSGWLLGADSATVRLPVSLSAYRVRDLIRRYFNEPVKLARSRIFSMMQSEEAAVPETVARLIAHMKPPVDPPEPISAESPGYYQGEAPGLPNQPPFQYLVQLPPEYDPYRRYPTVVTLNGSGTTPVKQIDWWAGAWTDAGWRSGQASRQGYIVIAPVWSVEHQKKYGYSAREHAAVLNCLRDACRRFAVDTDRVFLSGHSMGGDAAWDIGLAHPDLWAGVIPIVGKSDRFCAQYWENAKRLPFYVVVGELDGKRLADNARDLDRYLKRGFNCTVVEYLGRGHEHFYDEILRIFEWMGLFRRDFFPREFDCATMRQWDDFFWWVEIGGLPPRSSVDPSDWPPPRGTRPIQVKANITSNNGLYVRTGSADVTVWISPEMLDFKQRVNITVNGRRMNTRTRFIEPDLLTILEDVRTRADRQHPFWVKYQTATGRVH